MRNLELCQRRDAAISHGVGMMTQVYAERALNAEIWDIEGNRYIDFATIPLFNPATGVKIEDVTDISNSETRAAIEQAYTAQ